MTTAPILAVVPVRAGSKKCHGLLGKARPPALANWEKARRG